MGKLIAAGTLSVLLSGVSAQAGVIDLGGFDVEPTLGLTVITFENTDPSAVSSLTFDFTYISAAPSWTEELAIQITHEPSGAAIQLGATAPTFAAGADYCDDLFGSTCDADFGGLGTSDPLFVNDFTVDFAVASGLGTWTIEIGEGFDDAPFPDGRFEDGSVISIDTAVIPLPAAAWLLLSAVAGLAGLRRRG